VDRLSRPHAELGTSYSVVIVGSGYGGGIAAARLARCGKSVCVLERGREIHPGEYPQRLRDAATAVQLKTGGAKLGSPTALFDFRLNGDINVLVGCGLGGTSLINEGVTLKADPRVFDDDCWPSALRHNAQELEPYYELVEKMLGSTPYPNDAPELAKLESLAVSALALGTRVERPKINVTFTAGPNTAGIEQEACILCGDCVSGCNHNAKNTVLMNYLPEARRYGAEIFTQVEVRTVAPTEDGRWRVDYRTVGLGQERFGAPTQFVVADVVVLAAGTLGTTEILLRSRAAGLAISDAIGAHFHANGDAFGVGFDGNDPVHAMGFGHRPARDHAPVGPNIVGLIDLRAEPQVDDGLVIQEAAAPGALVSLLPAGLVGAAAWFGQGPDRSLPVRLWRFVRQVFGVLLGPYRGPTDRTQLFMVMGSEDTHGRIDLVADRAEVEWVGVADRPVYEREQVRLRHASEAIGATYIPDPLWKLPITHSAITVHPLGGAVMADDAKSGVVNDRGQVFSGITGNEVHDGLYVADGSVIPRSLVANPLLTISALAERTCDKLIEEKGWRPPTIEPPDRLEPPPIAPGLRFSEAMRGWCSTRAPATCEAGAAQGRADGSLLELVLTVDFENIEHTLARPAEVPGRVSGSVVAPELSPHRLTVTDGTIHLFRPDPDRTETVCMLYELPMVSEHGDRYVLHGEKVIHHGAFWAAWRDSTTLFVRITAGDEPRPVATGVVRVRAADFARGLTTFRVPRVAGIRARARYVARYFDLFRANLVPLYGGLLAGEQRFQPRDPKKLKPSPGLPAADVSWYDGAWQKGQLGEDAFLRLTRYHRRGGDKGPVMLAPGFGMTSDYLAFDTIEKNLAEFLVDAGYDVWLFDNRSCVDLESAKNDFTLDDIATTDWPTAVKEVKKRTGTESVQVVSHCISAMTFLMAKIGGLEGVRSAVCSQTTLFTPTSLLNRVKARMYIPETLQLLGVRNVMPNDERKVANALLDIALSVVPMPRDERCGLAVCRWINAIYGMTHHHAQLNDATHRAIDDYFGVANLTAFKQIALLMKKGYVVDHEGRNVYLAHPERLDIPLHFLIGKQNDIFFPEGALKTWEWLRRHHPGTRDQYTKTELPDYAHLDCFIGKNAATDVFPTIFEHLERYPLTSTTPADPAP
jgi:cholesterol oxidase